MSEFPAPPQSARMRKEILRGAYYGLIAWLVYGVLEYALAAIVPLATYPDNIIAAWYWGLTVRLWSVYAGLGMVFGAFAGFCAATQPYPRQRLEAAAALSVAIAYAANLCWGDVIDLPALSCAALIIGGLLLCIVSKVWRERLRAVANPWVSAALLLLSSRACRESLVGRPGWIKAAVPAGVALAMLIASAASRRLRHREGTVEWRKCAVLLGGMAAVLTATVYLNRGAPQPAPLVAGAQSGGGRETVVLITMDTVRADHLSTYGYERNTTPNLTRLAAAATLYKHAVAASDMTLPTHAAIFTGTYASWNGAHFEASRHAQALPISKSYRTLAEILSANGYLSMCVAANFAYFQPVFGFARGFAVFDSYSPVRFLSANKDYFIRYGVRRVMNRFMSTASFDLMTRRAGEINDRVEGLIKRYRNAGRPLFLTINYMDAHNPYVPPRPFDTMFGGGKVWLTNRQYERLTEEIGGLKRSITGAERDYLMARYDGGIAYLDSEIGKLMDRLKAMGLYENAMIVIAADHGESFGERHLLGHGLSVYQDETAVPLIIKYPRQHEARVVDEPVGQVDVLPTILEVLGYKIPSYVQGHTLFEHAAGSAHSPLISESFPIPALVQIHPRFNRVERALIAEDTKLISSSSGKRELYDLRHDPGELHNLCPAEPAVCAALQQRLDAWTAGIPRQKPEPRKWDEETVRRLRSLGYVQ